LRRDATGIRCAFGPTPRVAAINGRFLMQVNRRFFDRAQTSCAEWWLAAFRA
jgi:hypothetical protein